MSARDDRDAEIEARRRQLIIMWLALDRIKDATNFEGAKMTASIALVAANFEAAKDDSLYDEEIDEAVQDAISDGEGRLFARYIRRHLAARGLLVVRAEMETKP
ncbi:MAG: hypothetical protein ACYC3L_00650 [Gemmatimonadaceae bacterium]